MRHLLVPTYMCKIRFYLEYVTRRRRTTTTTITTTTTTTFKLIERDARVENKIKIAYEYSLSYCKVLKQLNTSRKNDWRRRVSIPVPLAC